MPTNTLNGRTFEVDAEGFFTDRGDWSEELAVDLAALIGVPWDEEHVRSLPWKYLRPFVERRAES